MSWLSDLLSGGNQAQNQISNYYNKGMSLLNPYITAGNTAGNNLAQESAALTNPGQLENQWASSYQESPYAQQEAAMAKTNGLSDASSMGVLGSTPALNAIQSGTSNIVNADRQNYLNNLMSQYQLGVGINQNMYNTGAGAANAGANLSNEAGQNAAQLAYYSGSAPGNLFGGLAGMGIGSFLGGPGGSYLAKMMFGNNNGSQLPPPASTGNY